MYKLKEHYMLRRAARVLHITFLNWNLKSEIQKDKTE